MATFTRSFASPSATADPIPTLPPVTTATFPSKPRSICHTPMLPLRRLWRRSMMKACSSQFMGSISRPYGTLMCTFTWCPDRAASNASRAWSSGYVAVTMPLTGTCPFRRWDGRCDRIAVQDVVLGHRADGPARMSEEDLAPGIAPRVHEGCGEGVTPCPGDEGRSHRDHSTGIRADRGRQPDRHVAKVRKLVFDLARED